MTEPTEPEELATKWNVRHRYAKRQKINAPDACSVLREQARLLPARGEALDIACGRGGNARFLQARGLAVSAWDISKVAVEELSRDVPAIKAEVRDVIQHPPAPRTFDVITISRFLHRALCPAIECALRPGGALFYQTFLTGLSNADFLLEPDELALLFPGLHIEFYAEPEHSSEAQLVAKRLT